MLLIDTGFVGQNRQRRKREVQEVGHEVGGGPGARTATPPRSPRGKERGEGVLLDHKYIVLSDWWKQQNNNLLILVKVKVGAKHKKILSTVVHLAVYFIKQHT